MEEEAAATRIQSIQRARIGRQKTHSVRAMRAETQRQNRELASVRIQAIARGRKGRLRVSEKRQQQLMAEKIQALHRGRLARKQLHETHEQGGVPLDRARIQKGLQRLGRNPYTLRYSFLAFELPQDNVGDVSLLVDYPDLQVVQMPNNFINSTAPFAELPHLIELNLSNNCVEDCLPFSVPHCKESSRWATGHNRIGSMLQVVDLSYNSITSMGDLTHHRFLQRLDLSNNGIRCITGIGALKYLRFLDVSHNRITDLSGLQDTRLEELRVSNNYLFSLIGLDLAVHLRKVDASFNQIQFIADARRCEQLTDINLEGNRISSLVQVECLRRLDWLRTVKLRGNPVHRLPYYRLRVLRRLQKLSTLDVLLVSPEEKVKAINFHGGEGSDLEYRMATYEQHVGSRNRGPGSRSAPSQTTTKAIARAAAAAVEHGFVNHLPPFEEDTDEQPADDIVLFTARCVVAQAVPRALWHVMRSSSTQ